jgi:hypothetical protein
MKQSGDSGQNSEATMEERSTSNVQRRTSSKRPALVLHATFDVERCMFDVHFFASQPAGKLAGP